MNGNGLRKKKNGRQTIMPFVCVILVWLFIIGAVCIVAEARKHAPDPVGGDTGSGRSDESATDEHPGVDETTEPATEPETEPETEPPPVTYVDATIVSAGDILAHMPQINYAKAAGGGSSYDFTNSFKYIKSIVTAADYAVVNLETTLAGEDVGYSGYPNFNAPDSLLDAVKDAGFDMMLFANNHCYDKKITGFLRTQEQFDAHGLAYIGARKAPEDRACRVVDINGIKVGMLNYADDLSGGKTDRRTINGKSIKDADLPYLNIYNLSLLDEFYADVESDISYMKGEGADIIIAYIHWGNEYSIKHNSKQEEVAQALCDRGVDVIIGGHPHVIQDVSVLTSQSTGKQTLCFYSLGNFVSNQNRRTLPDTRNNTYTEGGLIVTLTLRKYSTGEALVISASQTPTFVHRHKSSNGYYAHEIVPLSLALEDPSGYGLTSSSFGKKNAEEVFGLENDVLGGVVEAFNASVVLPIADAIPAAELSAPEGSGADGGE